MLGQLHFLNPLLVAVQRFLETQPCCSFGLLMPEDLVIVQTRVEIVEIVEPFNLVHPSTCKLHDRVVNCQVVSHLVELPFVILELSNWHLPEKLSSVRTQMALSSWRPTISLLLLFFVSVLGSEPHFQVSPLSIEEHI